MQLCGSLNILWHCLSLGLEWKPNFSFSGHCWAFQICCHIECSTLTASSFRIWNSSSEITSPSLALFIGSKVRCYKEQYYTGTWNFRSMNQGFSWNVQYCCLNLGMFEISSINQNVLPLWSSLFMVSRVTQECHLGLWPLKQSPDLVDYLFVMSFCTYSSPLTLPTPKLCSPGDVTALPLTSLFPCPPGSRQIPPAPHPHSSL